MKTVRFAVMLKVLGVNLIRAAAAWMAGTFRNPGGNGAPGCPKGVFPEANSELVCLHAAGRSPGFSFFSLWRFPLVSWTDF